MWALGIECGGTSSTAILVSPDGNTSEVFRFGPGNFLLLSPSDLLKHFQALDELILARFGSAQIGRIGVGMPGILDDSHKQVWGV